MNLKPIQEVRIQQQWRGLVKRRGMMRIMARRRKAAVDAAADVDSTPLAGYTLYIRKSYRETPDARARGPLGQ